MLARLLSLLLATTPLAAGGARGLDESIELLVVPGGAVAQSFAAQGSGTLHVWAASDAVDPALSLESEVGLELAHDEDSGGGTSAWLAHDVEGGEVLRVIVRVPADESGDGAPEAVTLHTHVTPRQAGAAELASLASEELDAAMALARAGDYAGGRAKLARLFELVEASRADGLDDRLEPVLLELGRRAFALQDAALSERAFRSLLAHREACLPEHHLALAQVRHNVAALMIQDGRLAQASELQRRVLDARLRTLPEDDLSVIKSRINLAGTSRALGDLDAARVLYEEVLEVLPELVAEEDPVLSTTRLGLVAVLFEQGELDAAYDGAMAVLPTLRRTRPAHDPDIARALHHLALIEGLRGEYEAALEHGQEALASRRSTLPANHPTLAMSLGGVGGILLRLGRNKEACDCLLEALAIHEHDPRSIDDGVLTTRNNLAIVMRRLGDLRGARAAQEEVLTAFEQSLPADHPKVLAARANLASTLCVLGDLDAARGLAEDVLEARTRVLPRDHPEIQGARALLSDILVRQGFLEEPAELRRALIASYERTLPGGHPRLIGARMRLASSLRQLGELAAAEEILTPVLAVLEQGEWEDSRVLMAARLGVARLRLAQGDAAGALSTVAPALETGLTTRPEGDPLTQAARTLMVHAAAGTGDVATARRIGTELAETTRSQIVISAQIDPPRELEARTGDAADAVDCALALALELHGQPAAPALDALAFSLIETARGAALHAARRSRALPADDEAARELRERLREAGREIARVARTGGDGLTLTAAVRARDAAQRALLASLGDSSAADLVWPEVESVSARLGEHEALISFRVHQRFDLARTAGEPEPPADHMLAFVLRRDAPLVRVDLGPTAAIHAAVEAWRDALHAPVRRGVATGVEPPTERELGARVAALVFDPLRPALAGATRAVIVPDADLHSVPFDALPTPAGHLGDELGVTTRSSAWELAQAELPLAGAPLLLAVGDVDYDAGFDSQDASSAPARTRSGWDPGFAPLFETRAEVRTIARLFDDNFGVESTPEDASARLLTGSDATRLAFHASAPGARFLHIAAHGYFASESIAAAAGAAQIDPELLLDVAATEIERVRALSPMVLCGLALAGANLPPDRLGRLDGILTAEELAGLDLSGAELAVLSACETHVGVRQAGGAIASLQRALHLAGVRSAITSLWQVPDEATRELMVDFYRRLWVQGKPRSQALWEARRRLRDQQDDQGRPRWRTRDWAGWVLTGEPD